jgi:hypothetical protein
MTSCPKPMRFELGPKSEKGTGIPAKKPFDRLMEGILVSIKSGRQDTA